jgi:hypothetical protein
LTIITKALKLKRGFFAAAQTEFASLPYARKGLFTLGGMASFDQAHSLIGKDAIHLQRLIAPAL